jgi:hypothetical protein
MVEHGKRSSASAGVLQSRGLRGRVLRASATAVSSFSPWTLRYVPFGKYCRGSTPWRQLRIKQARRESRLPSVFGVDSGDRARSRDRFSQPTPPLRNCQAQASCGPSLRTAPGAPETHFRERELGGDASGPRVEALRLLHRTSSSSDLDPAPPISRAPSECAKRVPFVCQNRGHETPSPEMTRSCHPHDLEIPVGSPEGPTGGGGRGLRSAFGGSSAVSRATGSGALKPAEAHLSARHKPYRVLQRRLSAPLLASSRFALAADSRRLHSAPNDKPLTNRSP